MTTLQEQVDQLTLARNTTFPAAHTISELFNYAVDGSTDPVVAGLLAGLSGFAEQAYNGDAELFINKFKQFVINDLHDMLKKQYESAFKAQIQPLLAFNDPNAERDRILREAAAALAAAQAQGG